MGQMRGCLMKGSRKVWHKNCLLYAAVLTPCVTSTAVQYAQSAKGANLLDTLADLGVPDDEARAYGEGVRRDGALLVVESSDDRAERGMEILRRLHPVDIHERTVQWRHEGWAGYDANAITSTPTSSAATTARSSQEQARSTTRVADKGARPRRVEGQSDNFRKHYVTAFGDRGAAYTDYEPAYHYGYELGANERYRGRDWAALEADAHRDWELQYPSTCERCKDAIQHAWEEVRERR